jgi:PleD family two-component response regulator
MALTQVIKEAHEALYEAKRSGCNKIVFYQADTE